MRTETFEIDTRGRRDAVERFADSGGDGLVHVFVPHATAGVALMETGSGSEADLEDALERLLPREDRYRHRHGSTGHGADHLLPVFVSPSLAIPCQSGRLLLGTWQGIYLCEHRNQGGARRLVLTLHGQRGSG